MRRFEKTHSLVTGLTVIIFILMAGMFIFKGFMIYDAKKNNKPIYEVHVNNFQQIETYMTGEYSKDEKSGCITFRDEFGIKHIVCNNYTITQY
jgi:3-dehydroquinate dehydratase